MRITELWRYPVKSLGGEKVDEVSVTEVGLHGDRGWGLYEPSTNTVLTARRAPDLLFATARVVGDEVVITLPDGTETNDNADLSRWLGRDVELATPTDEGATYENPLDVENEGDWMSWQGLGGAFHDGRSRVSIVSSENLGDRDIRRFRTNVLVTGGDEEALVGARAQMGAAVIDVLKEIDRCVMVTRAQPGLERDLEVYKELVRNRNNQLSVGASVIESGVVAVGDELRALGD